MLALSQLWLLAMLLPAVGGMTITLECQLPRLHGGRTGSLGGSLSPRGSLRRDAGTRQLHTCSSSSSGSGSSEILWSSEAREKSRRLSHRAPAVFLVDVLAGFAAALAVAPFLAAIDRVVTEKTSDSRVSTAAAAASSLWSYVQTPATALSQPPFLLTLLVYCSTYVAVNVVSSYCELRLIDPYWPKLSAAAVTNSGLGMVKDRYFAAMFGRGAAPRFPLASVLLLLARDLLTVGAGFNFPAVMAAALRSCALVRSTAIAEALAQVVVPLVAQLVVTPIHIAALDLYYRADVNILERVKHLNAIIVPTLLIRAARVLCAYGVAGNANALVKSSLRRVLVPPNKPASE